MLIYHSDFFLFYFNIWWKDTFLRFSSLYQTSVYILFTLCIFGMNLNVSIVHCSSQGKFLCASAADLLVISEKCFCIDYMHLQE